MLSAKEAATAVGMSKNGIIRAIHSGRLSATRNEGGQFVIDASELFRVYAPKGLPVSTTDHFSWEVASSETHAQSVEVDHKVAMLERMLRDKDDVIDDLRQRLDTATAQVTQLSAIIAEVTPPKAKVGWWQRLLGG